jgi:hypothetical protein
MNTMRKNYFFSRMLFVAIMVLSIFSCKKELLPVEAKNFEQATMKVENCNFTCADYEILQDSYVRTGAGVYNSYFEWRVTNPCPGNGKNGSLQNLSHWSFTPSECLMTNPGAVISAWIDTSSGNGSAWVQVPVPPIAPDPSGCSSVPVMKFNYGTKGSKTSYYRLVLAGTQNSFWVSGLTTIYFKSGTNTGCCDLPNSPAGVGCLFVIPTN